MSAARGPASMITKPWIVLLAVVAAIAAALVVFSWSPSGKERESVARNDSAMSVTQTLDAPNEAAPPQHIASSIDADRSIAAAPPVEAPVRPARPARPPELARIVLHGIVVDPSGQPFAHADVGMRYVRDSDQNTVNDGTRAQSDDAGRFEISVPAEHTVLLEADAPRFGPSERLELRSTPSEALSELRLALRAGARVWGEVLDVTGAPESGRTLQLHGPLPYAANALNECVTDDEGRFEFVGLPAGTHFLRRKYDADAEVAAAPEALRSQVVTNLRETRALRLKDGDDVHVVLGIQPRLPVKLFGTVSGADDWQGVLYVNAWPKQPGARVPRFFSMLGEHGRYEMVLDNAGRYLVSIDQPAGCLLAREVEIPEQAQFELDLELGSALVRGRVLDPARTPVARASVGLRRKASVDDSASGSESRALETRDDGSFQFDHLSPGDYALTALDPRSKYSPGRSWHARAEVTLAAAQLRDGIELVFDAGGTFDVSVVGPDGPMPHIGVEVWEDRTQERDHFSKITDARGRVRFETHPPGRWYVIASAHGLVMQPRGPFELATGAVVPVELALERGARVSVTIAPADRERVETLEVFDTFERRVGYALASSTSATGKEVHPDEPISLGVLAAGAYRLVALRERVVVAEQRFEVATAADTVLRLELGH